jgi:diketogulonate reductase-like aldo/keto reductase
MKRMIRFNPSSNIKEAVSKRRLFLCEKFKIVSTIPKSSNKKRLSENFDVFDFDISEKDINFINSFNENLRIVDNPMVFW